MSSFKQKLKNILYDSSIDKNIRNEEQKFSQIMLKAFRKIKRDNNRQSLSLNYKKYNSSISLKTKLPKKSNCLKLKSKGISPKTAAFMLQTLTLMKNENSRNNIKENSISESISKYLDDNYKMKRIIKRNMDYVLGDNSHSKSKYSLYNKPKNSFDNKKHINMRKSIYNLKQVYSQKLNDLMESKDDILLIDKNKGNYKNKKINIYETFNKFRSKPKNKNDSYSRNNVNQLFYRTNFYFKS